MSPCEGSVTTTRCHSCDESRPKHLQSLPREGVPLGTPLAASATTFARRVACHTANQGMVGLPLEIEKGCRRRRVVARPFDQPEGSLIASQRKPTRRRGRAPRSEFSSVRRLPTSDGAHWNSRLPEREYPSSARSSPAGRDEFAIGAALSEAGEHSTARQGSDRDNRRNTPKNQTEVELSQHPQTLCESVKFSAPADSSYKRNADHFSFRRASVRNDRAIADRLQQCLERRNLFDMISFDREPGSVLWA